MKTEHGRNPAQPGIGWAAAAAMVAIGAGWQLATRAGARSALAPIDLALLRYLVPALLLAPVWWRHGLWPAHVARSRLLCVGAGAGLPFGLLAMAGASLAPAAHMGALLPGASPVLVALLGWAWLGARPDRVRSSGLALLAAGLALVALPGWTASQGLQWVGDLLFLSAAALWALYTLALRDSGLGPWHAAALVNAWSALGVVPLWLASQAGGASGLLSAPAGVLLAQLFWQGLVAGVAGLAVYALAVRHVGPAATSAVGALVPAAVAAGGWLLLDEPIDAATALGVAAVVAGVGLAGRPA